MFFQSIFRCWSRKALGSLAPQMYWLARRISHYHISLSHIFNNITLTVSVQFHSDFCSHRSPVEILISFIIYEWYFLPTKPSLFRHSTYIQCIVIFWTCMQYARGMFTICYFTNANEQCNFNNPHLKKTSQISSQRCLQGQENFFLLCSRFALSLQEAAGPCNQQSEKISNKKIVSKLRSSFHHISEIIWWYQSHCWHWNVNFVLVLVQCFS